MRISVVATLYRSAAHVREFVQRIRAEVEKLTDDYEILLVDDGSPDPSLDVALSLQSDTPALKVIELSRNFGHHKAMMTGLEHADGDLVFLIDVDLEEPPELLGAFHRKLRDEDLDVVYGYQKERKGGLFERWSGRAAWWLIDRMLPIRVPHNHSTVRLMTRDYVRALVRHKEYKTAIGGLWVLTGFRQDGIEFAKGARGHTSYSFRRRLTMLLDSVTSFSELPLFFVFWVGCIVLLASTAAGCWLVVRRLTGVVLDGWVSTIVSIWFFGGLIVFSVGVVGLYVSRIFIETKHRPYTIVRRVHAPGSPAATRERVARAASDVKGV